MENECPPQYGDQLLQCVCAIIYYIIIGFAGNKCVFFSTYRDNLYIQFRLYTSYTRARLIGSLSRRFRAVILSKNWNSSKSLLYDVHKIAGIRAYYRRYVILLFTVRTKRTAEIGSNKQYYKDFRFDWNHKSAHMILRLRTTREFVGKTVRRSRRKNKKNENASIEFTLCASRHRKSVHCAQTEQLLTINHINMNGFCSPQRIITFQS